MGKNNRQRRAAKQRHRQRRPPGRRPARPSREGSPPAGHSAPAGDRPPEVRSPDVALEAAAIASAVGDDLFDDFVDELAAFPRAEAHRAVAERVARALEDAWEHGWQPIDLARLVGRKLDGPEAAVLRAGLAADAVGYAELGHRAAPAWMAQLDELSVTPDAAALTAFHDRGADDRRAALATVARLLGVIGRLPPIARLADPPSAWTEAMRQPAAGVSTALLGRIRALLAKAESTTFDAEAEAFTAKAQEMMARHRIDRAILAERGQDADDTGAVGRRIGVDDPYADAKAILLGGIAAANGARAVWAKELGSSTVFGDPVALDLVEELYTSLLVQATSAMRRQGSKQDGSGRSRTKAFRRSFLLGFAHRIADRLHEAVAATVVDASTSSGTDLVPLLARQDEAAEAAVREAFPNMRTFSPSLSDAEGMFAGQLAAEHADLGAGPQLDRRSA